MRGLPRIVVALLPLLLVAMGFVHVSHAHGSDEAASFHPACTLCQFHAPVATPGEPQPYDAEPGAGAQIHAQSSPGAACDICIRTHASRAPPLLLDR